MTNVVVGEGPRWLPLNPRRRAAIWRPVEVSGWRARLVRVIRQRQGEPRGAQAERGCRCRGGWIQL